jgi:hypothetical protein
MMLYMHIYYCALCGLRGARLYCSCLCVVVNQIARMVRVSVIQAFATIEESTSYKHRFV